MTRHPATFRLLSVAALLALGSLAPVRAHAAAAPAGPTRVVILSTGDVKGKTTPCGCSVPKGGLGRLAGFADSLRAQYGAVTIVDAGGFFPSEAVRMEAAPFLLEQMTALGAGAIGIGERELHFGLAYLRGCAARTRAPLTSANLVDRDGKAIFPATLMLRHADVKVGVFSVLPAASDRGPAKDSLDVLDPVAAAKTAVAALKAQGAEVIVALSNLGRTGSEDLCTAVPGIDVLIAANNVPLVEKGRLVDQTLVVYGGEQGQDAGRTVVTLDPQRKILSKTATVFVMDPTYADAPAITAKAKAFEDRMNALAGPAADSTHAEAHEH